MTDLLLLKIYQEMRPNRVPTIFAAFLCLLCFFVSLYVGFVKGQLPSWSIWTTPLMLALATSACLFIMPKNFTLGFLFATLPFMIAWRIGAMNDSWSLMTICTITFLIFLLQFLDCAYTMLERSDARWNELAEWQLTFLRLYFGYDMVGHFTEKLFAGYGSYLHMTGVFSTKYVISLPPIFVVMGGLCELAVAIGIGMGFLTRLTAVVGALYYLVASLIGSHFLMGYTWNAGEGGWEYCMLMMVFFISFAFVGASKFSIDGWLLRKGWIPQRLRCLFYTKIISR